MYKEDFREGLSNLSRSDNRRNDYDEYKMPNREWYKSRSSTSLFPDNFTSKDINVHDGQDLHPRSLSAKYSSHSLDDYKPRSLIHEARDRHLEYCEYKSMSGQLYERRANTLTTDYGHCSSADSNSKQMQIPQTSQSADLHPEYVRYSNMTKGTSADKYLSSVTDIKEYLDKYPYSSYRDLMSSRTAPKMKDGYTYGSGNDSSEMSFRVRERTTILDKEFIGNSSRNITNLKDNSYLPISRTSHDKSFLKNDYGSQKQDLSKREMSSIYGRYSAPGTQFESSKSGLAHTSQGKCVDIRSPTMSVFSSDSAKIRNRESLSQSSMLHSSRSSKEEILSSLNKNISQKLPISTGGFIKDVNVIESQLVDMVNYRDKLNLQNDSYRNLSTRIEKPGLYDSSFGSSFSFNPVEKFSNPTLNTQLITAFKDLKEGHSSAEYLGKIIGKYFAEVVSKHNKMPDDFLKKEIKNIVDEIPLKELIKGSHSSRSSMLHNLHEDIQTNASLLGNYPSSKELRQNSLLGVSSANQTFSGDKPIQTYGRSEGILGDYSGYRNKNADPRSSFNGKPGKSYESNDGLLGQYHNNTRVSEYTFDGRANKKIRLSDEPLEKRTDKVDNMKSHKHGLLGEPPNKSTHKFESKQKQNSGLLGEFPDREYHNNTGVSDYAFDGRASKKIRLSDEPLEKQTDKVDNKKNHRHGLLGEPPIKSTHKFESKQKQNSGLLGEFPDKNNKFDGKEIQNTGLLAQPPDKITDKINNKQNQKPGLLGDPPVKRLDTLNNKFPQQLGLLGDLPEKRHQNQKPGLLGDSPENISNSFDNKQNKKPGLLGDPPNKGHGILQPPILQSKYGKNSIEDELRPPSLLGNCPIQHAPETFGLLGDFPCDNNKSIQDFSSRVENARGPSLLGEPPLLSEVPSLLDNIPSLLGEAPLLGEGPSLLGEGPSLLGEAPSLLGKAPRLLGEVPSLLGEVPSLLGEGPSLLGEAPPLLNDIPSLFAETPILLSEPPSISIFDKPSLLGDFPIGNFSSRPQVHLLGNASKRGPLIETLFPPHFGQEGLLGAEPLLIKRPRMHVPPFPGPDYKPVLPLASPGILGSFPGSIPSGPMINPFHPSFSQVQKWIGGKKKSQNSAPQITIKDSEKNNEKTELASAESEPSTNNSAEISSNEKTEPSNTDKSEFSDMKIQEPAPMELENTPNDNLENS